MTQRIAPILSALFCLGQATLDSTIVARPLDQLGCAQNYYYDTSLYVCMPCGNNAIQNTTTGKQPPFILSDSG